MTPSLKAFTDEHVKMLFGGADMGTRRKLTKIASLQPATVSVRQTEWTSRTSAERVTLAARSIASANYPQHQRRHRHDL
jgi:hypothetical protein